MTRKPKFRSSQEISEDIATILEKSRPYFYWPEEHERNAADANAHLCGRRGTPAKVYLSYVRGIAVEAGFAEEVHPLIVEARRFLKAQEPGNKPRRLAVGR